MINIILPYENAPDQYNVWANEEDKIDFRHDLFHATRCTISFAATELVNYLALVGFEAKVCDKACDMTIKLDCPEDNGEEFSIIQDGKVVTIKGSGRAGVLYGVYEFLEAQGIRWYSPWEEYVPTNVKELTIPVGNYCTSMPLGRGFDFEGPIKESKLLYLWMARNKLNLSTIRHNTIGFQRKLCMSFKIGGHIFEEIINPNKKTLSGKTLFEQHADWYGKTDSALTPDNALATQFCVSNDELKEYLWQHLFELMCGEWYEADRIDVWGFDTWGRNCNCDKCTSLGNGSDGMLHFLSYLRKRLDETIAEEKFDHKVSFVMCSYEGTATIEPPVNAIPENMKKSGDYVVFYPILRCYEHLLEDKSCSYNKGYQKNLEAWSGIPFMVGEYYNVSKFEELPLVFGTSMPRDFANYHKNGVTGMTYMHLPMLDWGIKTLTQFLYAKLCWNVNADTEKVIGDYFDNLYGELSRQAKEVYALCEEAGKQEASWRAWGFRSILGHLLEWDGKMPSKDLYRDDHLEQNAVALGKKSIELLQKAREILTQLRDKADSIYMKDFVLVNGVAVNPNDVRFRLKKNYLGERISSDLRGVIYGEDMKRLLVGFLEYYEALYKGKDTEKMWNELRTLCLKCESYTYSVRYNHTSPELTYADVLERSQLRDLYYKCMAARENNEQFVGE